VLCGTGDAEKFQPEGCQLNSWLERFFEMEPLITECVNDKMSYRNAIPRMKRGGH
jgi:hypothetical protein